LAGLSPMSANLPLAVIDLGTNTVRLLVAQPDGRGGYRSLFADQEITRLGQGLLPDRKLQPEPIRRTLCVLRRFREAAEARGAARIIAVGTSALREAANRDTFLVRARSEAGVEVAVVSGEEEARLTLLGVRAALSDVSGRLLMMDIGGGSTEFLRADGTRILATVSTGLGVVKLAETYLPTDPPTEAELAAARQAVASRLTRVLAEELRDHSPRDPFVGTAGTVTTLAAIDLRLDPYDPDRVTGHELTRDRVAVLLRDLASLPLANRRKIAGLEPARADVIVAGALICLAAMDLLGFARLLVSDGGLREGILLDLIRRLPIPPGPAPSRVDPVPGRET
jgi:exopolyphosphatase / guanosine-5'-triphosphate,3'-diphosphate pyrophosphatase